MPAQAPRLLVIPGLHDSGPTHWQTWLEGRFEGAVRVVQREWARPDLTRWAARIANTLERAVPGPWLAVGHSFGALALAEYLRRQPQSPVRAGLLVAPADPARFGLGESLPRDPLPRPCTMVVSSTDPWLDLHEAQRWAARWGCPLINLGAAGHVNVASGHTQLPLAEHWLHTAWARWQAQPAALAEST